MHVAHPNVYYITHAAADVCLTILLFKVWQHQTFRLVSYNAIFSQLAILFN